MILFCQSTQVHGELTDEQALQFLETMSVMFEEGLKKGQNDSESFRKLALIKRIIDISEEYLNQENNSNHLNKVIVGKIKEILTF